MSKLFLGSCALVGAGIVVYACFVIFKADLPTAQHNSIIIGSLVLASMFVIVWGFAAWVRRSLGEDLRGEIRRASPTIDPSVVQIGERISRRLADND